MFHVQQLSGEPRAVGEPVPTFTSLAERNAAEASGIYPPGFVWQRTNGGTVVEVGYVDLAGAWQATVTAVADYAAAVALVNPQDGQQVSLLDQNQRHASGDLVYRASVPGGAVGWWLPKSISNLNDFAFQNGVRTSVKTANGGGADTVVNLLATGEWADISVGGSFVTDVAGDIRIDGATGRAGILLSTVTALTSGEKYIVLLRGNVDLFNAASANLGSKTGTHDGFHTRNISLTMGAINRCGFMTDAGLSISADVDCSSFKRMISVYEVGAGGSLVSRGWNPNVGWSGPSMQEVEGSTNVTAAAQFGALTDQFIGGNRWTLRELMMIRLNT